MLNTKLFLLKFVPALMPNSWCPGLLRCSPSLTWRDVQHVIVRSANPAPGGTRLKEGFWTTNKAGLAVSKYYGFGLMNAGKMVHLAKNWNTVPEQLSCEIKGNDENRFDFSLFSLKFFHKAITCCQWKIWFYDRLITLIQWQYRPTCYVTLCFLLLPTRSDDDSFLSSCLL